jgi:hypothetical protein
MVRDDRWLLEPEVETLDEELKEDEAEADVEGGVRD